MKYCTKCGYQLVDEARFCNACGNPVEVMTAANAEAPATAPAPAESENPYANVAQTETPVYTAPQPAYSQPQYAEPAPKTQEELRAEEQACLDKLSIGLKHETLCWRIGGIVFLVIAALLMLVGIADIDSPDGISNLLTGIMYLPVGIIDLVMAGKVSGYRQKLYTDCKNGVNHFSIGSIVFGALFNTVAMVFIIIYFIEVKNNKAVYDRIKANQDAYNAQQIN